MLIGKDANACSLIQALQIRRSMPGTSICMIKIKSLKSELFLDDLSLAIAKLVDAAWDLEREIMIDSADTQINAIISYLQRLQ